MFAMKASIQFDRWCAKQRRAGKFDAETDLKAQILLIYLKGAELEPTMPAVLAKALKQVTEDFQAALANAK